HADSERQRDFPHKREKLVCAGEENSEGHREEIWFCARSVPANRRRNKKGPGGESFCRPARTESGQNSHHISVDRTCTADSSSSAGTRRQTPRGTSPHQPRAVYLFPQWRRPDKIALVSGRETPEGPRDSPESEQRNQDA